MYHDQDDLFNKTSEFLNCLFTDIEKGLQNINPEDFANAGKGQGPAADGFHGSAHRPPFHAGPDLSRRIHSDMTETEDGFVIHAELAGFAKENIFLDYQEGDLVLRAKREPDAAAESFRFNDRRYGKFERRYPVGKVDKSSIHASYQNGILTISCSKCAEPEASTINID